MPEKNVRETFFDQIFFGTKTVQLVQNIYRCSTDKIPDLPKTFSIVMVALTVAEFKSPRLTITDN